MAKPRNAEVDPVDCPIRSIKLHVTDSGLVATVKVVGPAASGKRRLHAKNLAELAEKLTKAIVKNGVALG